jgi:peptidoglycan/LPS O-acetylase OafA/YrhL
VLAVILYHLTPGFLPGGYVGVDVFFVISGFLITGLLVRERSATGRIRLGGFWVRRARRLLPALGIVVLVCGSAAFAIGGNPLVHLGRQVLGAATFSSNLLSIAFSERYFDNTAPELFRNLWSLAVEEQFYLLWPLALVILLAVRSRWLRIAVVVALAVASASAMAVLAARGGSTRVYYGTDTHSFGLAIGATLAILHSDWPATTGRLARRILPAAGTAAVAAIVAIAATLDANAPTVYRGGLLLVAVLTGIAIAGAASAGSRLGRVLDIAVLRWIGERSYGLYLWHWPVFVLVLACLPSWSRTGASGWALGGIALTISTVAAAASCRFVERPIRRVGIRAALRGLFGGAPRTARRIGLGSAAVLLIVAMAGGTVLAVADDPGATDAQLAIQHGRESLAHPVRAPTPTPSPPQGPAALPGGNSIDAIGDSVMLASAPALQAGFPGIQIDAVVSRQLTAAPAIVQGMLDSGTLRPVLLIGLGTNGPIERRSLDQIRALVGPRHEIVVVNVQAPRGWTDGVNETLARFAQQNRSVGLADWRDAISTRLDLLAGDQIHPGPAGGVIYVRAITVALQRLSDLPPDSGRTTVGRAPKPR